MAQDDDHTTESETYNVRVMRMSHEGLMSRRCARDARTLVTLADARAIIKGRSTFDTITQDDNFNLDAQQGPGSDKNDKNRGC
jgi:hypothetical protein